MSWDHPFLADPGMPVVLASASPRRAEILRAQGLQFLVVPAEVDERRVGEESPLTHIERLALAKAGAIARTHEDAVVLGGDTVVVLDGEILGKPDDADHAIAMLTRLSGRTHVVHSSAALVCAGRGDPVVGHSTTFVRFRELPPAQIRSYVDSGEPMDKAGAWGIQGMGAMLVEHIEGGYFTVMGLPTGCLRRLWEQMFGAVG